MNANERESGKDIGEYSRVFAVNICVFYLDASLHLPLNPEP